MSKFYKEPIHIQPAIKKPNVLNKQGFEPPFKILKSSNTEPLTIKISTLSNVFNSPAIDDTIPIVGLGVPLTIEYGDKVWLETFYDKNLVPVASFIKIDNKWRATVKNTSNQSEFLDVYPNEFEFISKYDISDNSRNLELSEVLSYISSCKILAEEEYSFLKYFGIITSSEHDSYISNLNDNYSLATDGISELQSNLNNYFSAAPTATRRKLFKTYLPLAYTTKNMNPGPDGIDFIIPDSTTQSNPDIPQASRPSSFRLISCWNSDVLLVDYLYQNRIPAKTHIPFHRGVNFYSIDGKNEETENTQ